VRAGYKQTEVGIIPEEWGVVPLGNHVRITSGETPRLFQFTPDGVPYFKVEQLSNAEKHLHSSSTPYHFEKGKTVAGGSVVFAKRGAAIALNKVRILATESFMDTNLMALSPTEELDGEFLFYRLSYVGLWKFADTTSVPQINNKHVRPLAFPLPGMPEQRAIASALSDVDGLLGGLDRLIAKKRDLKQAAMQQLLTGQTRLPSFHGEWGVKRLGDVAHIKTGSRNNEDKVEDGQYPFFVRSEVVERINSYSHDCEAILVPGEGRIGDIFHYINGRFDVHQRVYAITKFSPDISGKFIHLYLSKNFGAWAMKNTVKATVDSLRLPTFQTFEMRLPPTKTEQTAIAEVLTEMDGELAALEQRWEKTHALKQAMMQELLTGRIRLV
jgi:type I restriction enzyme S subunit